MAEEKKDETKKTVKKDTEAKESVKKEETVKEETVQVTQTTQNSQNKKTTIMGLEEKWEVFLVYVFGILGFIFSFMKYDYLSDNIKFHYHQAGALWLANLVITIAQTVIYNITGVYLIYLAFRIVTIVLWVFLIVTIVKAFNNEKYEIPVISDLSKSIWKD